MDTEEATAHFSRTLVRLTSGQREALLAHLQAPNHPWPEGLWEIVSPLALKALYRGQSFTEFYQLLKGELVKA